jgi:pseudouridine-5'-phosphate glycosidase
VGLEKHEIQEMVDGNASKVSRRDFAVLVGDASDHFLRVLILFTPV